MDKKEWESLLYSDEEFHALYEISKGFNDDLNKNHRVRENNETFSAFIDEGSDALIEEHPILVKQLI